MTYDQLNEAPPRALHSWGVCYKGEPRKGAPAVDVNVWIPKEAVQPGVMADYIEKHLGWNVHRHGGWGSSGLAESPDGLTMVYVKVRAREIRAALAARGA
jgi:hypothetical protein